MKHSCMSPATIAFSIQGVLLIHINTVICEILNKYLDMAVNGWKVGVHLEKEIVTDQIISVHT